MSLIKAKPTMQNFQKFSSERDYTADVCHLQYCEAIFCKPAQNPKLFNNSGEQIMKSWLIFKV